MSQYTSKAEIKARLLKFHKKIRKVSASDWEWESTSDDFMPRDDARAISAIERRAAKIAAHNAALVAHLKPEAAEEVKRLAMAELRTVSKDVADKMANDIIETQPNFKEAIKKIWRSARSDRQSRSSVFKPLLIVSKPGSGKTMFARQVAQNLDLPFISIDCGSASEAFKIAGSHRTFKSGAPSSILSAISVTKVANPLVFLDELEKAPRSSDNLATVQSALLSLLEPESAKRWRCPFYDVEFDMSRINFIAAVNSLDPVSDALKSRFDVIEVGDLLDSEIFDVMASVAHHAGLDTDEQEILEAIVEARMNARAAVTARDIRRYAEEIIELRCSSDDVFH